jgi:hypothetical protein
LYFWFNFRNPPKILAGIAKYIKILKINFGKLLTNGITIPAIIAKITSKTHNSINVNALLLVFI